MKINIAKRNEILVKDVVCDDFPVFGTDETEHESSFMAQAMVSASSAKKPPVEPSSMKKSLKYSILKNTKSSSRAKEWVGAKTSAPQECKRSFKGILLVGKPSRSDGHFPAKTTTSGQCLQSSPVQSTRVTFHESIDWEAENDKAARRHALQLERKLRKSHQNETFLFLMLADINILIQCYNESTAARELFKHLFEYWRCPPMHDWVYDLYDRFVAIRRNKRCDPSVLLSLGRKFPRWPDKPSMSLWKLQRECSVFASKNKELTQRRVFYHLKFTFQASDLLKNRHDRQEHELFRKTLSWFLLLTHDSANLRGRQMFRFQSILGIEIQCRLAMLPQVAFDNLSHEAKSLLFLIGHTPTFQDLFKARNSHSMNGKYS